MKASISRFVSGRLRNVCAPGPPWHRDRERPLDLGVEDHAARRREHELAVPAVLDRLLEVDLAGLDRELDLLLGAEALQALLAELLRQLLGRRGREGRARST